MQGAKRLQVSARIVPVVYNANITWGSALPNQGTGQYVPVFWAEEYAEVSDSDADSFAMKVYGARLASVIITIAGEAAACVLVVVAVGLLLASTNVPAAGAVAPASSSSAAAASTEATGDNRVIPINVLPAPASAASSSAPGGAATNN